MKIEYSISGMDETGRHVMDPMFGDMDIRADGFKTVEAAREAAATLFGHSPKVAYVSLRESVQQFPGGSWMGGRYIESIPRNPPAIPIPDPEVEW